MASTNRIKPPRCRFLQLVGNAIRSTSVQFLANSVCCDTTWMRFFLFFSVQCAPGLPHSVYAGDNYRFEVGGLCSIYLTCCREYPCSFPLPFFFASQCCLPFAPLSSSWCRRVGRMCDWSLCRVLFDRVSLCGVIARAALLLVSGRSSLVPAACSSEDILRCPMCRRSQPHNGARSQHAPKQRKTGPTRKFWNRKIVHHNKWRTATSMVVFAKIRRCNRQLRHIFSSFPTLAGRAEMVCPDRYFVKC